ncbi:SAM-dependent methyltransferase [Actinomadura fulvescens]|uniref:SAM-dependent methyltransferase n=1 Tax=Actinomadura fulvescens TaxID=46160 RepID=A0ABN3PMN5_9ACTN
MSEPEAAPAGIDTSVPSLARIYDFFLGGKDNFAVDRAVAADLVKIVPAAGIVAEANRGALRRAVRHLVGEVGIRQLIDVGSGLPTAENVHEVAHGIDPGVRVVYVDNDPIVLAHGRALLADNATTTVIQADARRPAEILEHPDTRKLIDFDRPVGVVMAGILHHMADEEDPAGVAAAFRDALVPGSHIFISHFCDPGDDPLVDEMRAVLRRDQGGFEYRPREVVESYFAGLELVEPGLVQLHEWRPDPEAREQEHELQRFMLAGLGRKP